MGKHSSPERAPFVRSLAGWVLPWLLIAIVLAVAAVVVFDMVGNDPVRTASDGEGLEVAAQDDETEEPREEPREEPTQEAPEPKDDKPEKKKAEKPAEDDPTEPALEKLETKGVDIQVLNGTSDAEADDLMADKLARLGYSVVAVSPAAKGYPATTVFWTPGSEGIGRPLAERFGWKLGAAPSNLSSEVQLHVVVGDDSL